MLPTLGRPFADVSASMYAVYAVYAVMSRRRASPQLDLHLLHARPRESVPIMEQGSLWGILSYLY